MTGFRFHYKTPEELAAERKDPTWHRTHWFGEGFGWSRGDGGKVLIDDCPGFENLTEPEKDAVWQRVKAEKDRIRSNLRPRPLPVGDLDKLVLPVIRSAFPTNPLDDIVGVQPIVRPSNDH